MTRRLIALSLALFMALILGLVISIGGSAPVSAQTLNPWNSQFYNGTTFGTPISGATPVYPVLDLNWAGQPTDANGVAIPGVPADNFSVIFTSVQTFSQATYTFNVYVDDTARVTIDGIEILNVTVPGTNRSVGVVLAGGSHTIQVFMTEISGPAFIRVTWGLEGTVAGTPGGPTATPVPPTRTPLPPIPPGALTATVIRASVLNIRDAPSTGGLRIGRVLRGETYAVVGRDEDARWFLLQLAGYQGWAWGYYLFINGNEFNAPVVSGNSVLGLAGQQDFGVRAQTQATMRLRAAPTIASAQIGRISWGAFVPVVGRTANNLWWMVVWRGTVGWVYSAFLEIIEGNINAVPIRG